jgi:hypothetical protein
MIKNKINFMMNLIGLVGITLLVTDVWTGWTLTKIVLLHSLQDAITSIWLANLCWDGLWLVIIWCGFKKSYFFIALLTPISIALGARSFIALVQMNQFSLFYLPAQSHAFLQIILMILAISTFILWRSNARAR